MARALVVYCTKYGSTAEVAQAIADGLGADIADMVNMPDIHLYELIVVGSPIYTGDYLPIAIEFLDANKQLLGVREVAGSSRLLPIRNPRSADWRSGSSVVRSARLRRRLRRG